MHTNVLTSGLRGTKAALQDRGVIITWFVPEVSPQVARCSSRLYGLNDNVHLLQKSAGSNRGNGTPLESARHGPRFGRFEPQVCGSGGPQAGAVFMTLLRGRGDLWQQPDENTGSRAAAGEMLPDRCPDDAP